MRWIGATVRAAGLSGRTCSLAPVFRNQPAGNYWRFLRASLVVQIHPRRVEVIKATPQAKAGAGPFERLGFCRSHGVLFVRPLFASSRVGSKALDGQLAD